MRTEREEAAKLEEQAKVMQQEHNVIKGPESPKQVRTVSSSCVTVSCLHVCNEEL